MKPPIHTTRVLYEQLSVFVVNGELDRELPRAMA